eukprot:1083682-Rhodomonas_salina.3
MLCLSTSAAHPGTTTHCLSTAHRGTTTHCLSTAHPGTTTHCLSALDQCHAPSSSRPIPPPYASSVPGSAYHAHRPIEPSYASSVPDSA